MKHFFNHRETIVTEALDGFLRSTGAGDLARLDGYPAVKVVMRRDWNADRVAIVSGGKGTAAAKMDALRDAGAKVGQNPTEAGQLMVEIVKELKSQ